MAGRALKTFSRMKSPKILALLLAFFALASIATSQQSLTPAQRSAVARMARQGQGRQNATLGGQIVSPTGSSLWVRRTLVPGVFQLRINNTGTAWTESFLLGIPTQRVPNTPLLVLFHSYDVSEWDCLQNTTLFTDAMARGWYVCAPLGAHQVNFGIPYSQVNIQVALDFVTNLLPIAEDRIYGVGFSMGGGTLGSYAARHHDPAHARFASIVNHTGGISIANTFYNSADVSVFLNPLMFGDTPAALPFEYSQVSLIDLDFTTLAVDPNTDMARNLAHVQVLNQHADFDPLTYLIDQTVSVHNWMLAIPGMASFLLTPNQSEHAWWTIDENVALDFLRTKRLLTPTTGTHRILADREATWFHFYLYQDTPGAFTPLRWTFEAGPNRLTIDETENLAHIVINSSTLGLNTAVNLEVVFGTQDGSGEIATISGYAQIPQEVLRDGVPMATDWSYDPVAQAVTLTENAPAGSPVWKIRP